MAAVEISASVLNNPANKFTHKRTLFSICYTPTQKVYLHNRLTVMSELHAFTLSALCCADRWQIYIPYVCKSYLYFIYFFHYTSIQLNLFCLYPQESCIRKIHKYTAFYTRNLGNAVLCILKINHFCT